MLVHTCALCSDHHVIYFVKTVVVVVVMRWWCLSLKGEVMMMKESVISQETLYFVADAAAVSVHNILKYYKMPE